jgi:hypothetical protein
MKTVSGFLHCLLALKMATGFAATAFADPVKLERATQLEPAVASPLTVYELMVSADEWARSNLSVPSQAVANLEIASR